MAGHVLMAAYGLLFMVAAFFFNTPQEVLTGFHSILISPSQLSTDYMALTNVGATLFNSGLMTVLGALLLMVSRTPANAISFAVLFTVMGFSCFGKNPFNATPIVLGVFLFTRFMRIPFREKATASLYATGLGPLVSALAFSTGLPPALALALSFAVGLLVGFILPPLMTAFMRFHQGYCLYNAGFVNGIVGTVFIAVLAHIGFTIPPMALDYRGSSVGLAVLLSLLFGSQMLIGLKLQGGSLRAAYGRLMRSSGRAVTDFTVQYGPGLSLFNMGVCGFMGMGYALLLGGQLNGAIFSCIMKMTGYGSYGKHPRNVTPVMLGVLLMNLVTGHNPGTTGAVLAALFGTSLAPIAGQFGLFAGLLAGALHATLGRAVGVLHAGVMLYNNGFAAGVVAVFMLPWLELLEERGWLPGRFGRQPLNLGGDGKK
ncbi:MAG: DUF1576 domain-containing protein [Bacillota bacterium]|nr:DUF1576 domain-containing protein [Bacillota bacterium]